MPRANKNDREDPDLEFVEQPPKAPHKPYSRTPDIADRTKQKPFVPLADPTPAASGNGNTMQEVVFNHKRKEKKNGQLDEIDGNERGKVKVVEEEVQGKTVKRGKPKGIAPPSWVQIIDPLTKAEIKTFANQLGSGNYQPSKSLLLGATTCTSLPLISFDLQEASGLLALKRILVVDEALKKVARGSDGLEIILKLEVTLKEMQTIFKDAIRRIGKSTATGGEAVDIGAVTGKVAGLLVNEVKGLLEIGDKVKFEFTGVAQETTVVFLGLAGRAAILKADVDQAYIAIVKELASLIDAQRAVIGHLKTGFGYKLVCDRPHVDHLVRKVRATAMCVLDLQSGIGGMKFSLENGENALFKYNPAGRVPFKDALKCLDA